LTNYANKLCIEKPNELLAGIMNYGEESMEAYEEEGKSTEAEEEDEDDENESTKEERTKEKSCVVISSDVDEGKKVKWI